MMNVFENREENTITLDKKNEEFENEKTTLSSEENQEKINDFKMQEQSMDEPIIAVLNFKYYLIKSIGKGSSGVVFLSYSFNEETKQKTYYAVKLINTKNPNDNILNDCEVNFLEKMRHKNILKVYEHGLGIIKTPSGLKQQAYYIIMDYLNHGSLLSYLGGNIGFGEDFGRLIFAQCLDGLEAIHDSNIVHRDIKLENLMLSGNDYTLKYIDFGFATEKSNGYLTNFLGTPNYAAPELHLKQPYLGVYEDIFSLGVTLFIIVTGHLPFILALPTDPLYKYIFNGDYKGYWDKRNIKVSPSFMELFNNLIAFDPSKRPSINEIRNSQWMQEMNINLLPLLNQEYIRREEEQQKILYIKQKILQNNNTEIRTIKNEENNQNDTTINKNANELLLKIKENKKIEVINHIKKMLFSLDEPKEKIEEENNNKVNCDSKDKDPNKDDSLEGFIMIKIKVRNLNSLIHLLRPFFKNEGFTISKKDISNKKIEISNGEVDILLTFAKMLKEIKITYSIINGNKEDYLNFKKIMKRINVK